jgi:hypothetical protein
MTPRWKDCANEKCRRAAPPGQRYCRICREVVLRRLEAERYLCPVPRRYRRLDPEGGE